jgi:hypothetical protein
MESKNSSEIKKSTLLIISEDLYQIKDFDVKFYQNRKYNSNNLDQGKKFFLMRFIKNKLDLFINNKSSDIKVENKIIQQLDSKEKEKLDSYEKIYLNHKKTQQIIIKKYYEMFLVLLEKSIFYLNNKKIKESYDVLHDFNIINNEAEFGEILMVISGYDRTIIEEHIFKTEGKTEIIKGFLNCVEMTQFDDLFDCFKFINSRVIVPLSDTNKALILNIITDMYYESNKDNAKFSYFCKDRNNVFIFLNTIYTHYLFKSQNMKMVFDDFKDCISFLKEKDIKNIYDKLNIDLELGTDYITEFYEKLGIILEEKDNNYDSTDIKNLNHTEKIQYFNYLSKKEIIQKEMKNKTPDEIKSGISFIKTDFTTMSNLSFGKKEQDILSAHIKFHRITGSNTILKEYLLCENFTIIIFEKNLTNNIKPKHGNSININDIIDIKLGSTSENLKKYFKSFPNEEKNMNNFISIITQKEQFDLKSDDMDNGLKWFKALKALILSKSKTKEKKNDQEKKINDEINNIWIKYILPKWNIYGNYFLFKTLDRGNYLKDMNFNNEGKKQNPTIKYDIIDDKKTPLLKLIITVLKEIKDKIGKKELEFSEMMTLCQLGIADNTRKNIWPILIGNKCGITTLKENISNIDNFEDIENEYIKNVNINFIENNIINILLKDIIKIKYNFFDEITSKKLVHNKIMNEVYKICRSFFLYRFDIPYNKNIIFLIYTLLLQGIPLETAYICICNLICSNKILSDLYLLKKNYTKISQIFNEKFKEYLPKLYAHFEKLGINYHLYFTDWIETLFTNILDIKVASNIIDLYLIFGEYVLIQSSITILKFLEDDLINMNIEEILKELNNNHFDINIYQFLECYKNFGGIKNEYMQYSMNNEYGLLKTDLLEVTT